MLHFCRWISYTCDAVWLPYVRFFGGQGLCVGGDLFLADVERRNSLCLNVLFWPQDHADKTIFFYSSRDEHKRANAACLMCLYAVCLSFVPSIVLISFLWDERGGGGVFPVCRGPHATELISFLLQLIRLNRSPEESYSPFVGTYPPFIPFRDGMRFLCFPS